MDDIILPGQEFSFIGQPLRITFKEIDYQVKVLHKTVRKGDREVKILLDGVVQTLVYEEHRWRFGETTDNEDFAQAIWHAISLRYRL